MRLSFLKKSARAWAPPFILHWINARWGGVQVRGPYKSWDEAAGLCQGYQKEEILQRVEQASLKVKNGEAAYERDSVLFEQPDFAGSVLSGLLLGANLVDQRLSVLDFGGSLGSSYYQTKPMLDHLGDYKWSIVEQPHFVASGKEHFQDGYLKFYSSAQECMDKEPANLLLLSSVLQYLSAGLTVLDELLSLSIPIVLVDRTSFVLDGSEKIMIQTVPKSIYDASYPVWFFEKSDFLSRFEQAGYEKILEFRNEDTASTPSEFLGFLFKRKSFSLIQANALERTLKKGAA